MSHIPVSLSQKPLGVRITLTHATTLIVLRSSLKALVLPCISCLHHSSPLELPSAITLILHPKAPHSRLCLLVLSSRFTPACVLPLATISKLAPTSLQLYAFLVQSASTRTFPVNLSAHQCRTARHSPTELGVSNKDLGWAQEFKRFLRAKHMPR